MDPRARRHARLALALLAAALVACRVLSPEARRRFPPPVAHAARVAGFDVLSYGLTLELEPAARSIRGECRVRLAALANPLARVDLDLVGLAVESVQDEHGRALEFTHSEEELGIVLAVPLEPGQECELSIRYGGQPLRGLWYAGTREDGSGPTLVFSHGQTQGARGWFPCFDEPGERASLDLTVRMPAAWVAVAPGVRVETREEGAYRSERWRMDFPHPTYLVSLVAGELVVAEGHAGAVPLQFLAEPRFEEWIAPTFEETDEILAFLERTLGRAYPYAKYSQAAVDNFPWGGMENISATTLTPFLLTDERAHLDQPPSPLIAHEAAHQWFGDLFTCADWSHLWLNEGFATYLSLLYLEDSRGQDEFRAQVREVQEAYLAQDVGDARRPTVWNVWCEPDDLFDTRPYQGAAARLHLLRFVLGDEAFFAGVRAFVREHEGRSVTTEDFRATLERSSGRDLSAFFEQWFLGAGFPELACAWSWDERERRLDLAVAQLQSTAGQTAAVFTLPMEVEIRATEGLRSVRLELDERRERFSLPCEQRPLYVRFDPHGWIPRRLREDKPLAEWLAIASLDGDVNARREAALALGRGIAATRARGLPAASELAVLLGLARSDPSAWVRADAATALALPGVPEADDALRRSAMEDASARVRAAALYALFPFARDDGLALLGEDAFYAGPSYQVMAAGAALVCRAAPERAFEFLEAGLDQRSPHDVLAGHLLRLLAQVPDARVPSELRRFALDRELAPSARAVAVDGLAQVPGQRAGTARFLIPLLDEPSFHLRRSVVRALARLGDEDARRALLAYHARARTAEERRTIEALFERPAP